jgi:hypothetical protein
VGAVAAASTTVTIPLRGTRMASMATGRAVVTHTAADDYTVVVTLASMPAPASLHTTPTRHAYVAWVFDASRMQQRPRATGTPTRTPGNPAALLGTLVPIPLHAVTASTYAGTGHIMMKQMPGIIVTAEPSATVHKPAMPFWGVLIGRPMSKAPSQ